MGSSILDIKKDNKLSQLKDVFEFSSKINNQVNHIIDKIIRDFLKKNSDIIERAFKTKDSLDDLHYSIILKYDNISNRTKLFSFLDNFDLMEISQKHPIYFQFIPKQLIDKINYSEEITFEK